MTKPTVRNIGAFFVACTTDNLRPVMQHAMIDNNGSLWATDSHIMIKSDLDLWNIIDKDSIPNAYGKVLHRDKLKEMYANKVKLIVFEEEGVELYHKYTKTANPDAFFRYDATATGKLIPPLSGSGQMEEFVWLDKKGQWVYDEETNDEGEVVKKEPRVFSFPNMRGVIPKDFMTGYGTPKPLSPDYRMNALALNDLATCFAGEDGGHHYTCGVKLVKLNDNNSRPVMVLPDYETYNSEGYLKQFGLMMPLIGN